LVERNGKTFKMNVGRINGVAGDVVQEARDVIRETPFADDREFVRKLGLVMRSLQPAVARAIVGGERNTIPQAVRMLERQTKAREWERAAKRVELSEDDCTIKVGDCREVLATLPDASVDLVFTDPPYGIGENYAGFDDDLSRDELLDIIGGFAAHLPRLLKPTGSAFVMMSSRYMFDVWQTIAGVGLHHQQTLIWAESFGPHNSTFWTDCYRVVLHFTRDPKRFTFNHADTRTFIPSWRLENEDGRHDQDGKLPGNVWGVWTDRELARLVSSAERIPEDRAVNQLPVKLVERVVLLASNPGDTVLDAFHGTGTTARACLPHKRRYVGVEIDPAQAKASRRWIKALLAQSTAGAT
jgi:DNA modification methylase